MRPIALLVLAPLILIAGALRGATTDPADPPPGPARSDPGSHAVVARGAPGTGARLAGRLVPLDAAELSLGWATRTGEATFLEVLAHGSPVNAGDAVARLDDRSLRRELEDAERALADAERERAAAEVRARLATEDAAIERERASEEHERARDALEAWRDVELALDRRGRDFAEQGTAHAIDDAEEELRQLEAMYRDDELIEATEEIVLSRSRRDLAQQRTYQELARARRAHAESFELPRQTDQKQDAVDRAARALAKLDATAEIDAAGRAAQLAATERAVERAREEVEELRADLEALQLVSTRAGVLLHGGWTDWDADGARPEHRPGGRAQPRRGLFLVADPDHLQIALAVDAAQHAELTKRGAARVETVWGASAAARVELASYPRPDGRFALRGVIDRALPGHASGAPAELVFAAPEGEAELVVPARAVHGDAGAAHRWVAADAADTYVRTPVRLGARHGNEVVVLEGLAEGQRVLLAPGPPPEPGSEGDE